jgi:hypothetical protein
MDGHTGKFNEAPYIFTRQVGRSRDDLTWLNLLLAYFRQFTAQSLGIVVGRLSPTCPEFDRGTRSGELDTSCFDEKFLNFFRRIRGAKSHNRQRTSLRALSIKPYLSFVKSICDSPHGIAANGLIQNLARVGERSALTRTPYAL